MRALTRKSPETAALSGARSRHGSGSLLSDTLITPISNVGATELRACQSESFSRSASANVISRRMTFA